MKYSVKISEQADADLRGIYEYIAFHLQSIQNALAQITRLEKSIMGLDEMPERFRVYDADPWYSRGLRVMPVDNYCVFYIPDHEKRILYIIRVMYGGRDIDTQLKRMTGSPEL
jgi:toxin ParE1/3/4